MKPNTTSKPFFNAEQIAAALADAPDTAVQDADNPVTHAADWKGAVISHSLGELRRTRGKNKRPVKEQVAVRYSPEVLAAFKATGRGWQTRMNAALADWLKGHSPDELRP
jgi:uncharacterized protein (DUF4415 family)